MSLRTDLPVDTLRRFFTYNPDTGSIVWLQNVGNRAKKGQEAGSFTPLGYRTVGLQGAVMLAHRVAWAMHYGEWPAGNLDHFDGNPGNNAIRNLRLATAAENNANRRKVRSDAKHALVYPGVYWAGEGQSNPLLKTLAPPWPWMVRHSRDGKTVYRTQPDLLSAVALKMRLQAGGEIPPRGVKGEPGR